MIAFPKINLSYHSPEINGKPVNFLASNNKARRGKSDGQELLNQ